MNRNDLCRDLATNGAPLPVIDPRIFYPPDAPQMRAVGAIQTLNRWRCESKGPAYHRSGSRILYLGQDVLDWLAATRVKTNDAA